MTDRATAFTEITAHDPYSKEWVEAVYKHLPTIKAALSETAQGGDVRITKKENDIFVDLLIECPGDIWEKIVAKHYTNEELEAETAPVREQLRKLISAAKDKA